MSASRTINRNGQVWPKFRAADCENRKKKKEKLESLGIMWALLRASLRPYQHYGIEGFKETLNWSPLCLEARTSRIANVVIFQVGAIPIHRETILSNHVLSNSTESHFINFFLLI